MQASADPTADLVRAPCPSCGAQLTFSAEQQRMVCGHCGTTEALTFSKEKLQEHPLALQPDASGHLPNAPTEEKLLYACRNCGARTSVNYDAATITCAFCGSRSVSPEAQRTRLIEPAGVVPFQIGRARVTDSFRQWVGAGWLAPSDLKSGAVLDNLHGMYVPFWTFDAAAHSTWSGEAGTYYYVPVQTRDANGRTVTTQERRVRWQYRSGTHEHFYDDLLEMASQKLSEQEKTVREAARFELKELVDYDARVLLGWEAEVYSIDLPTCATKAAEQIRQREEQACSQLLGGDTQRDLEVDTTLSARTFKHLLLPLWICTYMYNGQLYRFLVNGQTGQIAGERPFSKWKMFFAVTAFILFVLILYYFAEKGRR